MKNYCAHNYFNIFTTPIFCLMAIGHGILPAVFCWALVFMVHPVMDWLMTNPFHPFLEKFNQKASNPKHYEIPLLLSVPFQALLVFHACKNGTATLTDALISGATCGLAAGSLGIATAHELMHRRSKFQRKYAQAMLFVINYVHFALEHQWHHVAVATPSDPDTAYENEGLYRFLVRATYRGWIDTWKRDAHKKSRPMLKFTLIQTAITLLIGFIFGVNAALMFFVQGAVTIFLLKWINYVEHYGLTRKKINGKYEKVGDLHSWDSLSPLTNFSLFNLGYHTQHHAKPQLAYYELPASTTQWNTLNHGYTAMMMLALYPRAWIEFMQPKLNAIKNEKKAA